MKKPADTTLALSDQKREEIPFDEVADEPIEFRGDAEGNDERRPIQPRGGPPQRTPNAEDEKEDCKSYIEGICPFGMSGKGCQFKHRKRCPRHCRNGTGRGGCKFGSRCWFLHLKICDNSAKMRICLDLECKKVHLQGTKRRISRDQSNYRPDNYNDRERRYNDSENMYRNSSGNYNRAQENQANINPWESRNKEYQEEQHRSKLPNRNTQEIDSGNQLPNKDNIMTFLGKCLEGVQNEMKKDMKEQMELQMNTMQKQMLDQQMKTQQYITAIQTQSQQEAHKYNFPSLMQPVYPQLMVTK